MTPQTNFTLQKAKTPSRNTDSTRIAYESSTEPLNPIEYNPKPEQVIPKVSGLTKETAHKLWGITTLIEKKEEIQKALLDLPFMKHDFTIERIKKAKKTSDLDMIIADIIIYSEDAALRINQKNEEKSNPFAIL